MPDINPSGLSVIILAGEFAGREGVCLARRRAGRRRAVGGVAELIGSDRESEVRRGVRSPDQPGPDLVTQTARAENSVRACRGRSFRRCEAAAPVSGMGCTPRFHAVGGCVAGVAGGITRFSEPAPLAFAATDLAARRPRAITLADCRAVFRNEQCAARGASGMRDSFFDVRIHAADHVGIA